jgi:8-oxo-dGDP phosphatase
MSDTAWFQTVASRIAHEGYSTVRLDTVRMPDGSESDREVVEHDDAVAIVPITATGEVLLLRQYRHAVGRYVLEVPAGKLDVAGESVEEAAHRELAEELAYEAATFEPLVTFLNSAGWTDERTHVLLATGCTPGRAPDGFTPEAEEADMEVVPMAVADALEAARTGVIVDSKTLIGLLLAAPRFG